MTPLTKTQPQFGKGFIINEKITFEMPSTYPHVQALTALATSIAACGP